MSKGWCRLGVWITFVGLLTGMPTHALAASYGDRHIRLGVANTWTALQTFSAGLTVSGGTLTLPNGVAATPTLVFAAGGGFYRKTGGGYEAVVLSLSGGTNTLALGSENAALPTVSLAASNSLGWSTNSNAASAVTDLLLWRDAANTFAQRNGTNAQEFRVYGTTTGSKYGFLSHDGTNPILGSSSGALKINATAVTPATTGTRYLCIDTAGVVASSASACSGT